jgi:hypothetical protein
LEDSIDSSRELWSIGSLVQAKVRDERRLSKSGSDDTGGICVGETPQGDEEDSLKTTVSLNISSSASLEHTYWAAWWLVFMASTAALEEEAYGQCPLKVSRVVEPINPPLRIQEYLSSSCNTKEFSCVPVGNSALPLSPQEACPDRIAESEVEI